MAVWQQPLCNSMQKQAEMMASREGMHVRRELKDVCRQLQHAHNIMDVCQLQGRQGHIWRCRTHRGCSIQKPAEHSTQRLPAAGAHGLLRTCITKLWASSKISFVFLSVFSPAAASCEHFCSRGAVVSWTQLPICCSMRRL